MAARKKKATKKKTAARRSPRSPRAKRARKRTPRGEKDPGGRPSVVWNPEVLKTLADLAEFGNTVEDIAKILGIGKSTLEEAISKVPEVAEAYKAGGAKLNDKLRRAQVNAAIEDRNATLLKWLGIQRLKQRDVKAVEVQGPDGGAIPIEGDLGPVVTRKLNELLRSRGKK